MPSIVSTTCQGTDQFAPTCKTGATDMTYHFEKCPSTGINLDTCTGRTGATDTILQINEGSIDLVGTKCVLAPSGKSVACSDDAPCAQVTTGLTSTIANAGRGEHGIFTFTVDAAKCGNYGLNFAEVP
jgi:hypothetical protein